MRKYLLWTGLLATAGVGVVATLWLSGQLDLAAIAGADQSADKPEQVYRPPAVTVVRPLARKFVDKVHVSGSLVAREEVLVAPQVEGQRVSELLVEAGTYVKKEQLLARLATANLDALVAQNDAALQRADAGIAQAKSSIVQARARLTESAASLKRARPLRKSGYLSQSTLEQRQANAATTRAALAMANDGLKLAESERAQALAQRRELLWRRSRTDIRAPSSGLVVARSAKVGAIATAQGEAMFRIVKAGDVELEADVTTEQLHRLKVGQKALIRSGEMHNIEGTLRLVSPQVAPDTRLGSVRIFIGRNDQLRIGTFTTASILTTTSQGQGVPVSAIMRDRDGPYVQTVTTGNKVAVRRITLGLTTDGIIEVVAGLTKGDRVIAKAGTFLGPGEQVTPVEAEAAPVKSAAQGAG